MRWSKTKAAFLAAVVVLFAVAVVQVGVGAAPKPDVSLKPDKTSATYPSVITLVAQVTTVTASTPPTAAFEVRSADSTLWVPLATITAKDGAPGRFVALSAPNPKNAYYRARVGSMETTTVYVAVTVPMGTPKATKSKVKAGSTIGFSGTIRPFHPNTSELRVDFQKKGSKGWRTSASLTTTLAPTVPIDNDMSKWVHTISPTKGNAGLWRVRSFHECPRHSASYSKWTYFTVVK